jgi:ankyrin repeat protein
MHIASEFGHENTALLFLQKGLPLHMPNKAGAVCLHSACKSGHVSVVKALLQKGAQIDARTKDNHTPLHVAVENCKYLVIQMLLSYGADVQVRGGKVMFFKIIFMINLILNIIKKKETPLMIAAKIKGSIK